MFLQGDIQQITQSFSLLKKTAVVESWRFTIKGEGQAITFDGSHADRIRKNQ